jgi:hypothetical protein
MNAFMNCYRRLRNAPDSLMIRKNANVDVVVFHRNKPDDPVWSVSKNGDTVEYSIVDAAFLIGTVSAVITLTIWLLYLYRKIRYIKRW